MAGAAMEPTLAAGTQISIEKIEGRSARANDVVSFANPCDSTRNLIMRVVALAHPDSTAELKNGKVVWECVDVVADTDLPRPVTLEEIKAEPRLAKMILVNNSRLSVQPVTDEEWKLVCKMAGLKTAP